MIRIRSEKLFPFQFQILGWIFVFMGLVTVMFSPYVAPVMLLLGGLILSGYRGVEIKMQEKYYREYNSFLLIRTGKWKPYSGVEKIYVNTSNTSQYVYTKVTTGTTFRNTEFNAYLKFDDGKKLHLMNRKKKDKIISLLNPVANLLGVPLIDNTAQNS